HKRVTLFLALWRDFGRSSNRSGGGRLGGLSFRVRRRRGGGGRRYCWGRGCWLFRGNKWRRNRRDREIAFALGQLATFWQGNRANVHGVVDLQRRKIGNDGLGNGIRRDPHRDRVSHD